MTEFVFELAGNQAFPVKESPMGCNTARFRLSSTESGTLVIGNARFPFDAKGAAVSAETLESGVHTPAFFVGKQRYEAPPLIVLGGALFFLPPSQAELFALKKRLTDAEDSMQTLCRRLKALEAKIENTHIF